MIVLVAWLSVIWSFVTVRATAHTSGSVALYALVSRSVPPPAPAVSVTVSVKKLSGDAPGQVTVHENVHVPTPVVQLLPPASSAIVVLLPAGAVSLSGALAMTAIGASASGLVFVLRAGMGRDRSGVGEDEERVSCVFPYTGRGLGAFCWPAWTHNTRERRGLLQGRLQRTGRRHDMPNKHHSRRGRADGECGKKCLPQSRRRAHSIVIAVTATDEPLRSLNVCVTLQITSLVTPAMLTLAPLSDTLMEMLVAAADVSVYPLLQATSQDAVQPPPLQKDCADETVIVSGVDGW